MLFDQAARQGFVVLLLLAAAVIIGRMLQGTLKDRVTDLKDRSVALEAVSLRDGIVFAPKKSNDEIEDAEEQAHGDVFTMVMGVAG
jgi:hypothetical protein